MTGEPINIFARNADPTGVVRRLRELSKSVDIDGPDDNWRKAIVTLRSFWKKRTLTFTYAPEYHAEPNWSKQMNGMQGYFSRFPDTERKKSALLLPTSFRFSLGTRFDPDFDSTGDPRLEIVYAIAQFLDGVLFTPSGFRDAHGRILYGSGGASEEDPEAVWPQVIGTISVPPSQRAEGKRIGAAIDRRPPNAERVACRALALAAVTFRAILEQDATVPEAAIAYRDLLAWTANIGLAREWEPEELAIMKRPLGHMPRQEQIDATWRLEGLIVLAWALGRFALPPHDQLVECHPLWDSLGVMNDAASRSLLSHPTLRSEEEIATLRKRLFALHWRLREYAIRPKGMDFAEFARTVWFGPLDISALPLIDGDLALRGMRIDRADGQDFADALCAAQERHQAVNWLWEGPEIYSRASIAT